MLTVRFDQLGVRPGDLLLDMGCGAGRHAFEPHAHPVPDPVTAASVDNESDTIPDALSAPTFACM